MDIRTKIQVSERKFELRDKPRSSHRSDENQRMLQMLQDQEDEIIWWHCWGQWSPDAFESGF